MKENKNIIQVSAPHDKMVGMDFPLREQVTCQAGEMAKPASPNVEAKTVSFTDGVNEFLVDTHPSQDGTYNTSENTMDSLAAFFARPVLIKDSAWNINSDYRDNINPWTLFFQNTRVINRISNYHLLRANLHVKVMINGGPFYAGRILVSYLPLAKNDTMTRNRALIAQDAVGASQRPHFFLNPTDDQGGEMVLPFFFNENYLTIPDSRWQEMGELSLRSLVNLTHANGGLEAISIKIFAWATDVKLSVPTSINPGTLVPQAGEYGTTPVSTMATAAAKAAGMLEGVPTIGPYAKATASALRAVSAVSHAMGYSKPVIIDPVVPTVRRFADMVTFNTNDPVQKLALDVKQELTIDPKTAGLDVPDEMNIKYIAQHESYLTSFSWSQMAQSESRLFSTRVDPMLTRYLTAGSTTEHHLTSLAYAALPFKYWRGTLKFRFQIVCSAVHRGRIKFVYEPYALSSSTTVEYNTVFTEVVDITRDKDVVIEVGWGQPVSYVHRQLLSTNTQFISGSTALPATANGWSNGVLSAYVVNELATPSSATSDATVLVFVSAGDDFEVAYPDTSALFKRYFWPDPTPQFGLQMQAGDLGETPDVVHPTDPTETAVLAPKDNNMMADQVFFGESITSLRQLIRRYTPFYAQSLATSYTGYNYFTVKIPIYPTHACHASTTPYNKLFHVTWLNYVMAAYAGYRGGTRYACISQSQTSGTFVAKTASVDLAYDELGTPWPTWTVSGVNNTSTEPDRTTLLLVNMPRNTNAITQENNNCVLNVEIPCYTNLRFVRARRASNTEVPIFANWKTLSDGSGRSFLQVYAAAAEDFTTFFYLGPPVLYEFGTV